MSKFKISLSLLIGAIATFILLSASSDETLADEAVALPNLTTQVEESDEIDVVKLSEAFGHLIGRNLEAPGFNFDLEGIIRGMRAAAAGEESPMSEEEYGRAIGILQERAFADMAADNLAQAETFLAANAHHSGIVALEEGKLQYRVEEEGEGSLVDEGGIPLIHYTGRFMDGTVFGTSADGDPIPLPLDQTIPGFSRGIAGMREGEKRTLFVHPDLGYGVSGHLPPNSLLVFEVEVIKASS